MPAPGQQADAVLGQLAGAALCQLANVVEEDRLLRRVEVRGVLRDLGEEGIGEEDGGLVLVARGRVAEQGGDVDLEGARETIERRQRGHGLAVLDLGDVGARHVHARGELTLREIANAAEIAHGGGDLDAFGLSGFGLGDERDGLDGGQLGQQGALALAADVVGCAELYELAVLAAKYLTFDTCCSLGLGRGNGDRRHYSSHVVGVAGGCQSGAPQRVTSDKEVGDVPTVTLGCRESQGVLQTIGVGKW